MKMNYNFYIYLLRVYTDSYQFLYIADIIPEVNTNSQMDSSSIFPYSLLHQNPAEFTSGSIRLLSDTCNHHRL